MRKCILLLGLVIGLLAILLALPPRDGEIWAVLVAGSPGFKNYAMQVNYYILAGSGLEKTGLGQFWVDPFN